METYRAAHHGRARTTRLTKLYSDTKKSALTSINVYSGANEQFPVLHRKFRIQKDRLITWGLEWSDHEKGDDGCIDDAVARAGLTETVDSVLNNIKEVSQEAERIQYAARPLAAPGAAGPTAKPPLAFDQARYEDLLKDLTASIDTLYDLSRSRRALARGEHPSFSASSTGKPVSADAKDAAAPVRKSPFAAVPSVAESEKTLFDPLPFRRPSLSPYAGLPPQIEASALRLSPEGPPPYEAIGVPSTTRLVAHLIRAKVSERVQDALGSSAAEVPVLVEYANFDTIYRDTHVPPPLQRLETLASYLQPMRPESQDNLSLLGCFEDADQPRIGLVYDVPYAIQNRLRGTFETPAQVLTPVSLLKLVQKANRRQTSSADAAAPPLEFRFRLALRLVEQLHAMHAREIPHGNINSSSVVFATTAGESPLQREHMRSPLLASFDLFSKCSVEGMGRDSSLNIYRHPQDSPQGSNRDVSVDIRFDLYSLSLVLLEVGLWAPIGDLYKPKYTPEDFKLRLEKLYIPKLAAKCGSAFMRIVQMCFRMADDSDLSYLTTDGLYEHLLERLHRCCALDEDEPLMHPLSLYGLHAFPDAAMQSSAHTTMKTLPYPPRDLSPLSQQQSRQDSLRPQSTMSTLATSPPRLTPLSSREEGATPHADAGVLPWSLPPAARQASTRSQRVQHPGVAQIKERVASHIASTQSFKDYKDKVTFIQQLWRERCARCAEARTTQDRGIAPEQPGVEAPPVHRDSTAPPPLPVRPKRREFPHLAIPPKLLDEWKYKYAYQLAKLGERALKGSLESSDITLVMYGESEETARPTFLFSCEKSTAKVKQVLRRHFKYDPAVYDLRVKQSDRIRRCRRLKRHGDSAAYRSMAPTGGFEKAANPDYQERPICGASIGAYRDDEHLPPVSFGGIVLVDGQAYGMSVHHMLEPEDYDDDEDLAAEAPEDDVSDTSSIRSADSISIYSHSDDESTVRPPSTAFDMDDADESHMGDAPGITRNDYEEIPITQPALDDAIDCDLHVDVDEDDEDDDSGIDEDHLLSYKLGQVYASSGLKRSMASTRDGFRNIAHAIPQEIDWALFELSPVRTQPHNVVKGAAKYCAAAKSGNVYPTAVRQSSELSCAKVHCVGRTSGLASGVMSSTMELVKIHGRSTFSASWTIDGDFGVGGDSGAWVISNDDGRVCGHVLASKKGRTFICPMDLLLNDIKETLGASSVALPRTSSLTQHYAAREREEVVHDARNRLRLDDMEGGVALPSSPARRSMRQRPFGEGPHVAAVGAVETAG